MRSGFRTAEVTRVMLCSVFAGILFCSAGCGPSAEQDLSSVDDLIEIEFPEDETEPRSLSPERAVPLVPGESFLFRRRLEQTLVQQVHSRPIISSSYLQIEYQVTFEGYSLPAGAGPESVQADSLNYRSTSEGDLAAAAPLPQFRVRFLHVGQRQELPGQPVIEFDSAVPANESPELLIGFQGLKDNGFRFWLSTDSELAAVDDFPGFLDRCAQTPGESAARVRYRKSLEATWGTEGAAQFLTDMLGIIPIRGDRPGSRWVETRTLAQPLPLQQSSEFVLGSGRSEFQILEWKTRLNPVASGWRGGEGDVLVRLTAGEANGTATIDRRSGLPTESRQRQTVQMQVRTSGGREFPQTKTTIVHVERLTGPERVESVAGRPEILDSNHPDHSPLRISQRRDRGGR